VNPRKADQRDPIERAIESALELGRFVSYGAAHDFVSDLEDVAGDIEKLVSSEPGRAVGLYEAFIAGCYEKADEVDDSSGSLGMFVERLFSGWIRARTAAGADRDETASTLLDWMEKDEYGFCHSLEREAVKAFDKEGLAAFERAVRARPEEGVLGRRKDEILRAVYAEARDLEAYVSLCERTRLSDSDCLAIARMHRERREPKEALSWVERGLGVKRSDGAGSDFELSRMKRELLGELGRGGDALAEAWKEYAESPDHFSYDELMRFVAASERESWHAKAMVAAEGCDDLRAVLELWLKTDEIPRLVARLRRASDAELEDLSHYTTEPPAMRLAADHPDVAARLYRAMGMRILNAKKSKYYQAALSNFEEAQRCYERAGRPQDWEAVVAHIRGAHRRKLGFMDGFEKLVAGQGPSRAPSFLDRARSRWEKRGRS
jgi:tetratricopeptide (TPR) repeat protein